MKYTILPGYAHASELAVLFDEYTRALIAREPDFGGYLARVNYAAERESIHKTYGPPGGRLLVAVADGGTVAGCVALRSMGEGACELKRFYVRPVFRGQGIGRSLLSAMIEEALAAGYRSMYLDSLPCLTEALHLYRSLGFTEIPRYNDSLEQSIFMMRSL